MNTKLFYTQSITIIKILIILKTFYNTLMKNNWLPFIRLLVYYCEHKYIMPW